MSLPTIANCYRVTHRWTHSSFGGQQQANVLHLRCAASITASSWATTLQANDSANMWLFSDNDAALASVDVTPLDGVTPTSVAPVTTISGTGSGEVLPALTAVLSLRTAVRGPANRGRMFMPWLAEGQIANGILNIGNAASCTAAWVAFQNALLALGTPIALVVASYKHGNYHDVTSFGMDLTPGMMRKRNRTP